MTILKKPKTRCPKISEIYPGHGSMSKDPERDLSQAIVNAKKLLNGEQRPSVSHFRPPFDADDTSTPV
jgi:hypothetical protein